MAGEELSEEPKIQILNNFLEEKIDYYKKYVKTLGPGNKPETKLLNELFKQAINEVWA